MCFTAVVLIKTRHEVHAKASFQFTEQLSTREIIELHFVISLQIFTTGEASQKLLTGNHYPSSLGGQLGYASVSNNRGGSSHIRCGKRHNDLFLESKAFISNLNLLLWEKTSVSHRNMYFKSMLGNIWMHQFQLKKNLV